MRIVGLCEYLTIACGVDHATTVHGQRTWPAVGTGRWALAVHRSHRLRHRCPTARTAARPIPEGMTIFCLGALCIVAKRYVLAKNSLKERIGNQGQRVDFLGRRRISTSGFAYTVGQTLL